MVKGIPVQGEYNESVNTETMTEEEAFALDEYYTKNPPKVDPSKAHIPHPALAYCTLPFKKVY